MVAIDFEKAFDSVRRVALVKALKFYMCDPRMIDVMVDRAGKSSSKKKLFTHTRKYLL